MAAATRKQYCRGMGERRHVLLRKNGGRKGHQRQEAAVLMAVVKEACSPAAVEDATVSATVAAAIINNSRSRGIQTESEAAGSL